MFYPSPFNSGLTSFATAAATAAENAAREAQTRVDIVQHDIDRLLYITEALWTLLKRQNGYDDNALLQLVQNFEQRNIGNEAKDPPVDCPACGRPNMAKRTFCIYCGKPMPANLFAR